MPDKKKKQHTHNKNHNKQTRATQPKPNKLYQKIPIKNDKNTKHPNTRSQNIIQNTNQK